MAKLADALASGASVREDVQVQVLFRAHKKPPSDRGFFIFSLLRLSTSPTATPVCNHFVTMRGQTYQLFYRRLHYAQLHFGINHRRLDV